MDADIFIYNYDYAEAKASRESLLISRLLPPGLGAAEILGLDAADELLPAERAALGPVCRKRLREFTAGRSCARRAMGLLGVAAVPVLAGPQRQPLWPAHIVGSITHCDEYCAAVVGPSTRFAAVGIDAELNDALPAETLDLILRDEERHVRHRVHAGEAIHWDRLVFSAKESVYKAWFSVTGRWLGFEDVVVTPDGTDGFRASLRVDGLFRTIEGRFTLCEEKYLLTAVVVPATRLRRA